MIEEEIKGLLPGFQVLKKRVRAGLDLAASFFPLEVFRDSNAHHTCRTSEAEIPAASRRRPPRKRSCTSWRHGTPWEALASDSGKRGWIFFIRFPKPKKAQLSIFSSFFYVVSRQAQKGSTWLRRKEPRWVPKKGRSLCLRVHWEPTHLSFLVFLTHMGFQEPFAP